MTLNQPAKDIFVGKDRPKPLRPSDDGTYSWSDIILTANILPELEGQVLKIITQYLGYLPDRTVTLPYELAMRGVISSHRYGIISSEEYQQQLCGYVKLVRNEEFYSETADEYDQSVYDAYWQTFEPFGRQARARICRFLGYEPDLRFSAKAELGLRKALSAFPNVPKQPIPADYKALANIVYRQALILQGKEPADVAPLPTEFFQFQNSS